MPVIRILAISGSLRAASCNTALLRAAAVLAPPGIEVTIYDGLGALPPFNPDLEGREPAVVMDFRARIQSAGAVLIACPEYAHGVPGVMKNALDWVVGSSEFVGKPVALINAAPRATMAQASLAETLGVMSANLIEDASIKLPLPNNRIDTAEIVADAALSNALRAAIIALAQTIEPAGSAKDA